MNVDHVFFFENSYNTCCQVSALRYNMLWLLLYYYKDLSLNVEGFDCAVNAKCLFFSWQSIETW